MAPITIRNNTLDPAKPGNVILPQNVSKTCYIIVQLQDSHDVATAKRLEDKGVKRLKLMCENNWLCVYRGPDLRSLTSIAGVQHALVYLPFFKLHANLKDPVSSGTIKDVRTVTIVLREDVAKPDDVVAELKKTPSTKVLVAYDRVINADVEWMNLDKIAQIDQVQAIEKVTAVSPNNNLIREIIQLEAVNKHIAALPSSSKYTPPQLTGDGQIVAVVDTGVDTDHDAFKNKVVKKFYYGNLQAADPTSLVHGDDYNGHGTHVAGTVLGSTIKVSDFDIHGMANQARLVAQAIPLGHMATGSMFQTVNLHAVFFDAWDNGACVSNNSWRSSLDPKNPEQARYAAVDAEVVDSLALLYPGFLMVFAAGNDGQLKTSTNAQIGGYAAAKNVLTVGASYSDRPRVSGEPPQLLDKADYEVGTKVNVGTIAEFSSRGPVLKTGRTKPDLVAPGVCILSARSTSIQNHKKIQSWIKLYGALPKDWGDSSSKFAFCSGTSMAAPAVSGCAALIREAFSRWFSSITPSAPLLKALLVNGADSLTNNYHEEGFGRINMVRTLSHLDESFDAINQSRASRGFWQGIAKIWSSTNFTIGCVVPQPQQAGKSLNLRATLVYHDLPGEEMQHYVGLGIQQKGQTSMQLAYDMKNKLGFNNVQRISVPDVKPGDTWIIHVIPESVTLGDSPWGIAWTCFET